MGMTTRVAKHCLLPLATLAAAAFASAVAAQDIAITHCAGACPQYTSAPAAIRAKTVVHHVFAAGLNQDTGLADWVAYRLTGDAVGVASLLPRSWQPDRLVKFSDAAEPIDINSSVYSLADIASTGNPYYGSDREVAAHTVERARLAPITSFANTPYWSDLNNLTNMVPMPNPLRLGAWLQLEQALNEFVISEEELYVVSGPLFLLNQPLTAVTGSGVDFGPAAYYKLVISNSGLAAFVFPANLPQQTAYCSQQASLEQIEQMTGLIMFPGRDILPSAKLLTSLGCSGN